MSLDELRQHLPPPSRPTYVPDATDWRAAEDALGTALPTDYKEFLRAYGSGRVNDFLAIASPGFPHRWGNLLAALEDQREVFAMTRHPVRYGLHPDRPGLLPIGGTDNGDTIFYLVDGEPDHWKIAVLPSRGRDVVVFDRGLTSFLAATMSRELDVFPEDFAEPSPNFTPR